jgi:hypothetical protein
MSESVIEGYLREFSERLAKIEEAQKRNSRVEDEERKDEEENERTRKRRKRKYSKARNLKLLSKVSKKRWSSCRRHSKRLQGSMITLPPWEASQNKNLRSCHPSLLYPKSIGLPEWAISKQHLRQYLNFVKIKGLNEQQVLQAFPLSLAGSASNWYYTLNVGQTKIWGELVEIFIDQFSYNTMIDIQNHD